MDCNFLVTSVFGIQKEQIVDKNVGYLLIVGAQELGLQVTYYKITNEKGCNRKLNKILKFILYYCIIKMNLKRFEVFL